MPANRHSYVRFFASDWIGGTARLSRLQRSLYFDVCVHNWDRCEPLSRAEQEIVFGDVEGWSKEVDLLVAAGKLKRTRGGGLISERAMIEARSARDRFVIARSAGSIGGRKTQEKRRNLASNPSRGAKPIQNQIQNQKEEPPIPPKGGESVVFESDAEVEPAESYSGPFETWWGEYPNKTGKRKAAQCYEAAFKRLGGARAGTAKVHGKLLDAVKAQRRVWRRTGVEGRYIPHASTWLNQSRWDDEAVVKELGREAAPGPEPADVGLQPLPPRRDNRCRECGAAYGMMHKEGCGMAPQPRGWVPGQEEDA